MSGKIIRLRPDTAQKLAKLKKPGESWNRLLHRLLNIPFTDKRRKEHKA